MLSLSRAQARRIALAAQGFLDPAHAVPTLRTFQRTLERTGVLQVDSVNVLQRAHYMPLYSRMGPYDVGLLERASSGRERRRMVEYWAHVQAFMPVELWPHMRHRMERYRAEKGKWGLWDDRPDFEQEVLAAVRDRGPVTARHLDEEFSGPRTKEHWGWNWSEARRCLDYLFLVGEVAIAGRTQPVRGGLRRARAGAAGGGAGGADAHLGGRPPRAGPAGRPLARRGDDQEPERLLPDAPEADRAGGPRPRRRR